MYEKNRKNLQEGGRRMVSMRGIGALGRYRIGRGVCLLAIMLAAIGCATIPEDIPSDLTSAELVQLAQNETNIENFEGAIVYYETIIERFDDAATVMTARYEIAFLHYEQNKLEMAREEFEAIVRDYGDEANAFVPEWIKVLAQKLISIIDEDDTADSDEATETTEQ